MKKLIAALILASGVSGTALADDMARASVNGSEMIAGGEVVMDEPVDGNAFAAGGHVEIRERVERSAFVSGGNVTVAGSVGRNLYAAGGELRLEGDVEGKARVAGGTVTMTQGARIHGDLRVYAEKIFINGSVGGDVEAAGESIRIGPDARIAGRISYRSRDEIAIDPAAQVGGVVAESRDDREWLRKFGRGATIVGGITVSLGMVLLGAILILGMPRFSREAAATIRRKPWHSIGLGCVMLIAVPFAIVILMVTLVGIPLALMLAFGYVAILLLGFLVAAIFLGDLVLERVDAARLDSAWWRALFLLLAVVAIAVVKLVPVIGDLAWWLLFLAGLGAFTMRAWQGFRVEADGVSR